MPRMVIGSPACSAFSEFIGGGRSSHRRRLLSAWAHRTSGNPGEGLGRWRSMAELELEDGEGSFVVLGHRL